MGNIAVIVGSTREGRFSEKPAKWIFEHLKKRKDVDASLLDLRDYNLPFFDQPISPATPNHPPYPHEIVRKWTAEIARNDGFICVSPEYNHGTSAVLKNALDWVWFEWNRKPIAFVSYGNAGGARAVEHLRDVSIELELVPIRRAIHIPLSTLMIHFKGGDVQPALAELDKQANSMLDDLIWWTRTLKNARETSNQKKQEA